MKSAVFSRLSASLTIFMVSSAYGAPDQTCPSELVGPSVDAGRACANSETSESYCADCCTRNNGGSGQPAACFNQCFGSCQMGFAIKKQNEAIDKGKECGELVKNSSSPTCAGCCSDVASDYRSFCTNTCADMNKTPEQVKNDAAFLAVIADIIRRIFAGEIVGGDNVRRAVFDAACAASGGNVAQCQKNIDVGCYEVTPNPRTYPNALKMCIELGYAACIACTR